MAVDAERPRREIVIERESCSTASRMYRQWFLHLTIVMIVRVVVPPSTAHATAMFQHECLLGVVLEQGKQVFLRFSRHTTL